MKVKGKFLGSVKETKKGFIRRFLTTEEDTFMVFARNANSLQGQPGELVLQVPDLMFHEG